MKEKVEDLDREMNRCRCLDVSAGRRQEHTSHQWPAHEVYTRGYAHTALLVRPHMVLLNAHALRSPVVLSMPHAHTHTHTRARTRRTHARARARVRAHTHTNTIAPCRAAIKELKKTFPDEKLNPIIKCFGRCAGDFNQYSMQKLAAFDTLTNKARTHGHTRAYISVMCTQRRPPPNPLCCLNLPPPPRLGNLPPPAPAPATPIRYPASRYPSRPRLTAARCLLTVRPPRHALPATLPTTPAHNSCPSPLPTTAARGWRRLT